ncbi:dTDP-4-dehydrorhamnose 3,5-epimerase [Vibrio nitrifigilis]|uniref:dTDP-4-dehydrorhamnose 3,5-epimerase n=1 Tax=Vibrio nitrifigilis TaxID=2789781 RepID=A0ABS0GFF6_9VIBR|nr:dTDP-4-dehydrorhamnose 3,5-epimerase [Vibrio nitrifigilis]MBF9001154.1 dTDP-4-dehydrorhamnose 3,5-epimerase [Vibrio nitrifigilis]
MKVLDTKIPDVKIIEPEIFSDERGFFMETWKQDKFDKLVAGKTIKFLQDNHSKSIKGTLRGLHYQTENTQGKLVRVIIGEVYDVAVDVRIGSPTFGQWVGHNLSCDNRKQMWIPEGFAHGFYVLSDEAQFEYKCTDYYNPQHEQCIKWDDPAIGIKWPIVNSEPIISEKDNNGYFIQDENLLFL